MAGQHKLSCTRSAVEQGKLRRFVRYQVVVPWIEIGCSLLLAGLLLWKGIIPAWRTLNSDFPNYYLAARLLHEGYSLDRIYDWIWLQRIKDHWGVDNILVGFAGLTPFSAFPLLPFAGLSVMFAKHLWIWANIFFLCGTAEILNRVTCLGRQRIWIVCLLAIIPLRTSFLLGQMHLLVLLLLALGYLCYQTNKRVACGICLGLAGSLKVYPFLFIIYFLWKRRWREALSIFTFTLVLLGIGYVSMGGSVIHTYLTQVLPRSLQGEVLDPYNTHAASGAAFLHRLFIFEPELNPVPIYNSPGLYAVLYPLWQVAILLPLFAGIRSSSDKQVEHLEWAAFVFALLLLSPVPSSYHFVVLIFSMALFVDVLVAKRERNIVAVAVTLYFLICTIELIPFQAGEKFSLLTFLAFSRLWIGMLFWLLFVFYLWKEWNPFTALIADRWRAIQLVVAFGVLWMLGFSSYHRHFAYFKEDISRRMHLALPAYLATGIHTASGGFLYTAMTPMGYRLLNQDGREVGQKNATSSQVDELTSAATADHPITVLELANATGSHIVSLPAEVSSATLSQTGLGVLAAESPAVSPDGSLIAYLREEGKGKHSLWLAHLKYGSDQVNIVNASQVVSSLYDVRDVTFAGSGNLMFSARMGNKTDIFKDSPGREPTVLIAESEDVDSPAVSPDEEFVVFRKLLHNRWQLVLMGFNGRQERYLTSGDCNAYAPAWMNQRTIAYATDCGRGYGLTALASVQVDR
jgi:Glycosyltransferase family 87/WD40-like Beta Propeller Repeat